MSLKEEVILKGSNGSSGLEVLGSPVAGLFPKVDLESWRQFIVVSDSGGFLPASRILKIDPAAISRRMKNLEDTLQLELFVKDSRGLFLTVAAQVLLQQVREPVNKINRAISSISTTKPQLATNLRIGLSKDLLYSKLLSYLTDLEFKSIDKELNFQIISPYGLDIAEKSDFQLTLKTKLTPGEIEIGKIPGFLFASNSYLSQFGNPQVPEELIQHTLLETEEWDKLSRLSFKKDENTFVIPNPTHLTFRYTQLVIRAAVAGQGIAFFIPQLVKISPYLQLIKLLPEWEIQPLSLVLTPSQTKLGTLDQKLLVNELKNFLKICELSKDEEE